MSTESRWRKLALEDLRKTELAVPSELQYDFLMGSGEQLVLLKCVKVSSFHC